MADSALHPPLIEGILPAREVSLLAGASGAGKTTLLMQILKWMQDGQPIFGHEAQKDLRIGYIAADRTWSAYEELARRIGLDLGRIKVRTLIDDDSIDLRVFEREPLQTLFNLVGSLLPLDLIVVDPLIIFMGCETAFYHQNAVRLIQLNRWCRTNQITILGTHHATKARTDYSFLRPQDRINGTGALLGFTSTQLFLAAPEEIKQEWSEWHIVSHHAKPACIQLMRNEQGLFEAIDPAQFRSDRPRISGIRQSILNLLAPTGEPLARKIIVDVLSDQASARTIDSALIELTTEGWLERHPGGLYGRTTRQRVN